MEVADQVASARAAPATNESNKCPAALSSAGAGAMCATSLLFAWLAAWTLRRCSAMDEEEVFPGVLWGLSPLICAYLYSWTAALSPKARTFAKSAGAVVARVAFLLLLAVAADKLIGPIAGATAIILVTLLFASVCGRALAGRRQRAGTERWSAATVASTPIYRSRAEEGEERRRKAVVDSCMVVFAVMFAMPVWLPLWLAPETEKDDPSMEVIFFLAGPWILAVRLLPPCMFGSYPVLANLDDSHLFGVVSGVIGWLVVSIFAGVGSGMIAAAVVFWIGELGILGFVGYYHAVEAHYQQIIAIERRKPRTAKDASGLLEGRDSDDACSAHIDAAAGLCVDCFLPRSCKRCKHTCMSKPNH